MSVREMPHDATMEELAPLPSDEASRRRLLSFYDGLRTRITGVVGSGRWRGPMAEALLLVPDVFILLVRLALDREVPRETRRLLGGALAYFLLPLDLLPEIMLGPGGYVEDLVLACVVVAQALGPDLETYADRHWSGKGEVRSALTTITRSAKGLLSESLFSRLQRLLGRRGFEL